MVKYEIIILATPDITKEETTNLESQVTKIIKKSKGDILSFDKWGKYKLAYSIRKYDYGTYFLVRFEISPEEKNQFTNDIRELFSIKYQDIILRHLISSISKKESEYIRPKSLEETPSQGILYEGSSASKNLEKFQSNKEEIEN